MEINKNCLIIKKSEYDSLKKEIKDLKNSYELEITKLKNELKEAEKKVKPEEIQINIFEYIEHPSSSWSKNWVSAGEWSTSLNLSDNIKLQINRILKLLRNTYENKYIRLYDQSNMRLEKFYKDRMEIHKDNFRNSLLDRFKNGYYYKSSTICKIIKDTIQ